MQGPTAKKAWKFIEDLDKDLFSLEKTIQKNPAASVFTAGVGASLFYHYLYKASGEKEHKKRAQSLLELAVGSVGKIPSLDYLMSGFTGAIWLAEHYRRDSGKKWPKAQDPFGEIDKYLEEKINGASELGPYGICDTWVGYGVFATERFPNGKSQKIICDVINLLYEKADRGSQGFAWYTPFESIVSWAQKDYKQGYYNIGVSHGIGGVIGLLTRAYKLKINPELTKDMLQNSIQWLLAQDDGEPFGYILPESSFKKKKPRGARLAWCYGDLGLSVVLLNAAKVLKDDKLRATAIAMAKRGAGIPHRDNRIVEPTFCHGAIGAFHIFNRLHQETRKPFFRKKALYWAQETFHLIQDYPKKEKMELGLVTGKTGIGLALISGVTDISPEWDRYFLIT